MDLNLLGLFVTVAETGSFSEAARRLGLPKSSVSRGVASLEASLGTQLLHRTTRHVSLSTAGAALYERAAPLLASLKEAVGTLPEREEAPSGELRLTAPHDMGATFLPEVIARFTTRYPSVRIDCRLTNRNVDLVAEGFDLALRASGAKLADSSLVVRRLSPIEVQLFASPTYLARRGTPRAPEDLAHHDIVAFRGLKYLGEIGISEKNARVLADDMFFLREAVKAGSGIAILPTFLAQAEVTSGQLVRVLPRYTHASTSLVMLYPRTQHVPRKVSAFRDFLLEFLKGRPLSTAPAGG
ncbi:LysR family transcriptional regulator [Pyxidicoccus fallax]|uniref:LysR family transcriptional regulator n=1 Tax=Pyxidicoccus fallax TaxID=394095 RepID=A0A848L7N2_9BACT|nr:LysR family transcriptional regulator [Pyxidicoccus fallax]NMO14576.1 LysR family transcriptional regulator [Pyxidicoccus fallax]NPC79263.1 LysR family transcriptional regulator [Pyxidicoccus fallax]